MKGETAPFTFRCGICNLNWPYTTNYRRCENCGELCRALRLIEEDDIATIMTHRNARLMVEQIRNPKAPVPVGREPTPAELRRLHDAMEAWAHKPPWWVR